MGGEGWGVITSSKILWPMVLSDDIGMATMRHPKRKQNADIKKIDIFRPLFLLSHYNKVYRPWTIQISPVLLKPF